MRANIFDRAGARAERPARAVRPALIHQKSHNGIEISATEERTGEKPFKTAPPKQLPYGLKNEAVFLPRQVCFNGWMKDLSDDARSEPGFIDEKELLARLPISRRTLGNWKENGIIPFIKIGRRCLYDWASVQGALMRQQRGGG